MGSPLIFGPPPQPSPEVIAQIEAYRQAVIANDIAWRKTLTGPWCFLWCGCREVGPQRCQVHGTVLLAPDGTVL